MIISVTVIDTKNLANFMFTPKTERIENIAKDKQEVISQLDGIFSPKTRVYIDYANVRPWSEKLGWHIELKRLKQFLDSFNTIEAVNFYNGYLAGNERSEKEKTEAENNQYFLRTKPVKIMKMSIDVSSIIPDSTVLLSQFIRRALLKKYEITTVEYLNERFKDMNKKGEYFIEDMKCNFDVEIGRDMLLDYERNKVDTYILWSGDSDFTDSVKQLLEDGKKVFIFATSRRVATELSEIGVPIFDIRKIKEFICWPKELPQNIKSKISNL